VIVPFRGITLGLFSIFNPILAFLLWPRIKEIAAEDDSGLTILNLRD